MTHTLSVERICHLGCTNENLHTEVPYNDFAFKKIVMLKYKRIDYFTSSPATFSQKADEKVEEALINLLTQFRQTRGPS